jgi:hypothetical protein
MCYNILQLREATFVACTISHILKSANGSYNLATELDTLLNESRKTMEEGDMNAFGCME